MKGTDRRIIAGVLGFVVVIAVYLLVIAPKRAELSDLSDQVSSAESAATQQEQLAATALQAKSGYRAAYQRLVVLGKAVPGDDDVSSLLNQVNGQADEVGIEFKSLKLAPGADAAAPAAVPAEPPPAEASPSEPAPSTDATAVPAGVPASPTETAAAALPLGATVGPAGLPTMPYELSFTGGFFDIADFMAELDGMVKLKADGAGVNGRLLTVDGFSLVPSDAGFPELKAALHVTSFVTPADQGVTAGATPEAPAAAAATTPTTETAAPPLATGVPTQ